MGLALAVILTGCANGGPDSPTGLEFGNCRFPPAQLVEVEGNFYEPLWGPIRSDLIRGSTLSPTEFEARDERECPAEVPGNIHEVSGVPIEQVFAEVRDAKDDRGGNASTPLACHHTNEAYAFTAIGSAESPPPFSRLAATQAPSDSSAPTPPPTPPLDGPLVELSAEGLIDAGWPVIHLPAPDGRNVTWDNGVRVLYGGVEYRISSYHPLDDRSSRSFLIDDLEPVEVIRIEYRDDRWPEALGTSMPHVLESGIVEDRVRIYRPADRSADDVIVVDPCPTYPDNLQPNNLVFWGRVTPGENTP